MQTTEVQNLLLDIIEHARSGQSTEFHFIQTWADFKVYIKQARSTKLLIKTLRSSANRLFKSYCQDVVAGLSDVNKILAYAQLQDIIAFYEKDADTLDRMLDDYDNYLSQGNFWHSFLGGERKYYFQKDENIWNIP